MIWLETDKNEECVTKIKKVVQMYISCFFSDQRATSVISGVIHGSYCLVASVLIYENRCNKIDSLYKTLINTLRLSS